MDRDSREKLDTVKAAALNAGLRPVAGRECRGDRNRSGSFTEYAGEGLASCGSSSDAVLASSLARAPMTTDELRASRLLAQHRHRIGRGPIPDDPEETYWRELRETRSRWFALDGKFKNTLHDNDTQGAYIESEASRRYERLNGKPYHTEKYRESHTYVPRVYPPAYHVHRHNGVFIKHDHDLGDIDHHHLANYEYLGMGLRELITVAHR